MGNRNEDFYDDEDRVSPTKHSRSDVVCKLRDNKRKHMRRRLSAA